jgi:succinate dehydrogenase/fumarate reductase flavoprotein subunit
MRTISTDVVVVGGGASGLVAATAARRLGREVVVLEASDSVGGSTAASGGMLWLPGNEAMRKLGETDSADDARAHLNAVLGETTPASTRERREAFLATAPKLARWFEASKLALTAVKGQADYVPSAPGWQKQGRTLLPPSLDRRVLGPWLDRIRVGAENRHELRPRTPSELVGAARAVASRLLTSDRNLAKGGAALVIELLNRALGMGVGVWTSAPMSDLVVTDGRVIGVLCERNGEPIRLLANDGVVLACGGFEANQSEREEQLPLPTDAAWSAGCPSDTGAAIAAARAAGAEVAAMSDAWWVPVVTVEGVVHPIDAERRLPGSILVDQAGYRFVNEAGPSYKVGKALYDRHRSVRSVPSFLIMDNRFRSRYELAGWLPGVTPRSALSDGDIVRADSLSDLATALEIDRAGLLGTVVRFNGFASKGADEDFRRGDSALERSKGDASKRRNPCLGSLDKAPYWAVRVYPGDRGTKGGVLIDAASRALRPDGSVLPGLYACGGSAASLVTQAIPAEGTALAVACVEAFRAALHACGQLDALDEG